jgi:hypothetical protein
MGYLGRRNLNRMTLPQHPMGKLRPIAATNLG